MHDPAKVDKSEFPKALPLPKIMPLIQGSPLRGPRANRGPLGYLNWPFSELKFTIEIGPFGFDSILHHLNEQSYKYCSSVIMAFTEFTLASLRLNSC